MTRANRKEVIPGKADVRAVLGLLGEDLRADLLASLKAGIRGQAIMPWPREPLGIVRASLAESIRAIEGHPRGELLQRFLRIGPYYDAGAIPPLEADRFLPDDEVAAAISFIYAHVIRTFQGRLAELLAIEPVLEIVRRLHVARELPDEARLYVGDVVAASREAAGAAKGGDLHVLSEHGAGRNLRVTVFGVGEVKSYPLSQRRVMDQIRRHLARAALGLVVGERALPAESVRLTDRQLQIAVVPARWRLPRLFRFEERDGASLLHVEPARPPLQGNEVADFGDGRWSVRLRWSHEALASAAFDMTFWYMEKVGEVIYGTGVPAAWAPMTPAEAGRNAAKMMLYYAVLRARSAYERHSAVALYNAYGFGYALGSSFRDSKGRREMLWPEDLREILERGVTKHGCRLRR
jgi:hypothetical protein